MPTTSIATPSSTLRPAGSKSLLGARSRIGSKEPSAELIASTKVLAKEMPMALTLCPNISAPNPQAKPAAAIPTAVRRCVGNHEPCAVMLIMVVGIRRHETTINRLQTCSHSHRPRERIGSVKLPFIMPEVIASNAPIASVLFIFRLRHPPFNDEGTCSIHRIQMPCPMHRQTHARRSVSAGTAYASGLTSPHSVPGYFGPLSWMLHFVVIKLPLTRLLDNGRSEGVAASREQLTAIHQKFCCVSGSICSNANAAAPCRPAYSVTVASCTQGLRLVPTCNSSVVLFSTSNAK
jgi:hypothetical protein